MHSSEHPISLQRYKRTISNSVSTCLVLGSMTLQLRRFSLCDRVFLFLNDCVAFRACWYIYIVPTLHQVYKHSKRAVVYIDLLTVEVDGICIWLNYRHDSCWIKYLALLVRFFWGDPVTVMNWHESGYPLFLWCRRGKVVRTICQRTSNRSWFPCHMKVFLFISKGLSQLARYASIHFRISYMAASNFSSKLVVSFDLSAIHRIKKKA